MMTLSRVAAVTALAAACVGSASAATLQLASYGSTASAPSGISNTATLYLGLNGTSPGPSYNVPTNGVWFGPMPNSSWVSDNPNDYPNSGGPYVANGGPYVFTSTFFDTTPGTSSGTITVLADDTTSVYLNGTLIVAASGGGAAPHCDTQIPNCLTATTFTLTGFIAGTNTLLFQVQQQFDNAMGLDYTATVNTVPEPSSLMLLGTGLMSASGMLLRRRRAA